jgi:hypothetical protein
MCAEELTTPGLAGDLNDRLILPKSPFRSDWRDGRPDFK